MPGGVVVVAPLGRALGVTARPGGHIHGEHQRVGVWQDAHQQIPQLLGVDAAAGQGGIDAAPAPLVDRLQAQVGQRRDRGGAQQCVAKLEQRIGTAGEAGVQLAPEAAEPRQGKVGIGMTAQPDGLTTHRQLELHKRPRRVKSQAKDPGGVHRLYRSLAG
jgi:hypothetical protein